MDNKKIRDINYQDFFKCINSKEKIKHLLKYAILAPSTHNSQPWLCKIKDNSCQIFINFERYKIKKADPFNRDLYISLGCFLENLIIVSKFYGVFKNIQYHLDNSRDNLIAEIFFDNLNKSTLEITDPLLESLVKSILIRYTSRGPFDNKKIDEKTLEFLLSNNEFEKLDIKLVSDKQKVNQIALLTQQALELFYSDPDFRKEMSYWFVSNLSKRKDGITGYSINLPTLISLIFPWLVRNFNIGKLIGKLNYKSISSSPAIILISADDNYENYLNVGRLAEQIMLKAHSVGLKTSIYVAAIEIGIYTQQIQEIFQTRYQPQFLICIGYKNKVQKLTPRYSVEEILID